MVHAEVWWTQRDRHPPTVLMPAERICYLLIWSFAAQQPTTFDWLYCQCGSKKTHKSNTLVWHSKWAYKWFPKDNGLNSKFHGQFHPLNGRLDLRRSFLLYSLMGEQTKTWIVTRWGGNPLQFLTKEACEEYFWIFVFTVWYFTIYYFLTYWKSPWVGVWQAPETAA